MESSSTASLSWHRLDAAQVLVELKSDATHGISAAEAAARRLQYGVNEIEHAEAGSIWRMIAAQFADFMIVILLVAALVSGVVGELRDTAAIVVILVLNATIGVFHETRARRAVAALRSMAAPEAAVIREGTIRSIPAAELVPGDLVLLEAGNVVPADLRLIDVTDLSIDESALTGESEPVAKIATAICADAPVIGDRLNLAYKTTNVTRGKARGVVFGTGQNTEIGRIAQLLSFSDEVKTPLQRRLARFGRQLGVAVLGICALVFLLGLAQGQPPLLMFLTAVTLAVAAVPEALPAVTTISLAVGAHKLAQKNALVRNLPAVETLGSVTYICADKTGTLTENRMSLHAVFADGRTYERLPDTATGEPLWREFGRALALNNEIEQGDGGPVGDPTELATFNAAADAGFHKEALSKSRPLAVELAFDAERKRMTTLHRHDGGAVAYVKGAPETVLPACSNFLTNSGAVVLDHTQALSEAHKMAQKGYRVLALACREFPAMPDDISPVGVEKDLTFLGLVGLIDPPRSEARQAVADCRAAGIVPVMITGDHPETARYIAEELGISASHSPVVTGEQLADFSDEQLRERARETRVYARVDPEQKIRVVRALQQNGEFVAMTGDGVNDAPALKQAGIGIAMGQRGTDVAREAADMVLLNDNFATIVGAVREGRRIFDDIRKFIKYTMTSNAGEIWTLLLAPLIGLPIPLLPIHILWINLLTDGLPGLALTAEPAERHVMQRPPRPPQESIFSQGMWQHMLWVGLLIGLLSIGSQAWAYERGADHWQTVVFTTLVIAQLFHVLAIRSERDSLLQLGFFSNPQLVAAVLITVGLQLAVIYVPFLNPIFKTTPLPLPDLFVCFVLGSLVMVAVEIEKRLIRNGQLYGGNDRIGTAS